MLTEERHAFILDQVKRSGSVTMTELCEQLGASESTVRRDLTQLDEKGLLKKVHGGAIAADDRSVWWKMTLNRSRSFSPRKKRR